jgi:small-conductance mechanosensitive channel
MVLITSFAHLYSVPVISQDKVVSDLRAKLAEAERQLQSIRIENSSLKSQLTKAKSLAKQLADL